MPSVAERTTSQVLKAARQKKYYDSHKEVLNAKQRKNNWYYDPIKRVEIRRKHYEKNWAKVSISSAKSRANKKGLPFNLDIDWFMDEYARGCAMTGLPLDPNGSKTPWTVHIDRKIPELGYTKDNARLVCACYNLAKKNWTDADILKMAHNLIRTTDA